MATLEVSLPLRHQSDADFRLWSKMLFDSLIQVGGGLLTQTNDAGQINFDTATRPALNTRLFFVLKFEDGLGRPLYLKFQVGTANVLSYPVVVLSISTGTDGAGNPTGSVINQTITNQNRDPQQGTFLSYFCVLPGYIAIVLGKDYMIAGSWFTQIALCRHHNTSGEFQDTGCHALLSAGPVLGSTATISMHTVNFDGTAAQSEVNYWANVPFGKADTSVGGKVYCLPVWYQSDRPMISNFLVLTGAVNVALGSDISLRALEATPRNFRNIGLRCSGVVSTAQFVVLAVWE